LDKIFRVVSMGVHLIAALALTLLSCAFIGEAAMLDAVSLVIIALAVFDVAKFLVEEEISRDKEMRSAREARQTLTKFMTIVIIVLSLEGIVYVFEAGKEDITNLVYPVLLLAVVLLMVVSLGAYHRLTRAEERPGASD
jgi:phosphate/sulfate permease